MRGDAGSARAGRDGVQGSERRKGRSGEGGGRGALTRRVVATCAFRSDLSSTPVFARAPSHSPLCPLFPPSLVFPLTLSDFSHGPNGLVNVKDANGESILKGRNVTGFSDAEERAVGAESVVPFMLETRMKVGYEALMI